MWGEGLRPYAVEAKLGADGGVVREAAPARSGDEKVLAPFAKAFQPTGGLKVLSGNLGHAVIKTSAVKPERRVIEAPAMVFDSQQALNEAFKAGELTGDFVAVIRFQGPKANGMPELHKLTTVLGILQDRGQQGGAGDRRAHVGRLRQGAGGDPCHAGSARRRRRSPGSATATSSGSTPTPARWRCWCRPENSRCAEPADADLSATNSASAASCSPGSGRWSAAPTMARAHSERPDDILVRP